MKVHEIVRSAAATAVLLLASAPAAVSVHQGHQRRAWIRVSPASHPASSVSPSTRYQPFSLGLPTVPTSIPWVPPKEARVDGSRPTPAAWISEYSRSTTSGRPSASASRRGRQLGRRHHSVVTSRIHATRGSAAARPSALGLSDRHKRTYAHSEPATRGPAPRGRVVEAAVASAARPTSSSSAASLGAEKLRRPVEKTSGTTTRQASSAASTIAAARPSLSRSRTRRC